jgi:hypothetical protein
MFGFGELIAGARAAGCVLEHKLAHSTPSFCFQRVPLAYSNVLGQTAPSKNRGPGMGKKAAIAPKKSSPRRKAIPKKAASSTRGRRQSNPISSFVNRLALEELEQLVEAAAARRDELRRSARAAFFHEVKARAASLGVSLADLTGSRGQKTAAAEQAGASEPIPSHNFLVFLDETGDEKYSDPKHAVFGIAGCAIISDEYVRRIQRPWNSMKRDVLNLAYRPFHAVEFERSGHTPKQIAATNLFLTRSFYRIAVTTDVNTRRPKGFDGHRAVSTILFDYIRRLVARHSIRRCMVFFEQSDRGDPLLERNLPLSNMPARNLFDEPAEVAGFILPKRSMEAGLELADLIAHTSGKQQRGHVPGYASGVRNFTPDFKSVFHAVPSAWTLYQSVTSVQGHSPMELEVASAGMQGTGAGCGG